MAYAFDGSGFGQFLVDAQRLITGARDHERHLASLVAALEHERARVGASPIEAAAVGSLALADRLRLNAGEHRQLAETLLTRLIGPVSNGALSSRIRVLVVDDSDSSRETTATVLEEAGFEAITATNGLEGVIVTHYAQPLVVLMDVTMPVLDGLETIRNYRRIEGEGDHTPIIAITAYDVYGMEEAALETGCNIYLSKPLNLEELDRAVKSLGFLV